MDRAEDLRAHMVRLRDGDRDAFDPVYRALWPLVRDFAVRTEGPDGHDVAQRALMKVFEQAARYDPAHRVEAWALTLTAWEIRTERRRRGRRREEALPPDAEGASVDPEADLIRQRLVEEVQRVIGTLRPQDRETLAAAFGETHEGGPTFRKRKQRALARLRSAWRARHG